MGLGAADETEGGLGSSRTPPPPRTGRNGRGARLRKEFSGDNLRGIRRRSGCGISERQRVANSHGAGCPMTVSRIVNAWHAVRGARAIVDRVRFIHWPAPGLGGEEGFIHWSAPGLGGGRRFIHSERPGSEGGSDLFTVCTGSEGSGGTLWLSYCGLDHLFRLRR